MKRTHLFEAEDGNTFETAKECRRHEESTKLINLLFNLEAWQVREALDRTSLDLADAFERAGNIIAAKRRESGELKRVRKGSIERVAQALEKQLKANT